MPRLQLGHVLRQMVYRCKWRPTPAEVLEIAAEWERNDKASRAKARAKAALRQDRQSRLDDARLRLRRTCWGMDGKGVEESEVAAWPEGWLRIFETEGWLRMREGGGYYLAILSLADNGGVA